MRRILILAAVTALTVARPETYKEQEDFKYSRSSSDEGSKSGFYGAQRGNMGGNYERAHNMDNLAQHQMSGVVNQVEGELGDGAKARTGSVYSAANSRGIYGSGNYDLSNLAGRNFQEGTSFGDSQSQSSSSSLAAGYNNAAYTNSRAQSSSYGGYQAAAGRTGHSYPASGDSQALHLSQGAAGSSHGYGEQSSSGYNSQSGYNSHTSYGQSEANTHSGNYDGSDVRTRLISAVPVKIIFRPGTRVAIPVGAQTYDLNQGSSIYDANQRSSSYDTHQRSSSYGQSSVNSEAEALNGVNLNNAYKPGNDAKHYESSYSYRKEWERHNTIPPTLSIATESPLPRNSELYEDSKSRASGHQYEGLAAASQTAHHASGYNANVKSSASQSRYRSGSNSQQHQLISGSDAYTQAGQNTGFNGDLNSQVEHINSEKPKSYQSSYSYHKSWERQGDPYEIKPASNGYYDGPSSQRLYAGTKSAYGSHHQSQVDCDELCGHARVARDTAQYQQQAQNLEDFGQQSQNLEDFGQQSQNLENFGQQSQNLEDFGQQSQNLNDFGQQSQKLEDFGQQSQQSENIGQQTQQNTWGKLEDLGQQSQTKWENLEDLGQQVQNKWDQQNQNTWENAEDLGQQTRHNPEHNSQDIWDKLETKPQKDDQRTQNKWNIINTYDRDQRTTPHQIQNTEDLHNPPHNEWDKQQSQFNNPNSFSQSPRHETDDKYNHRVGTIWDRLNIDTLHNTNYNSHTMQDHFQNNNDGQQIQSTSTYGHNWNVDTNTYTQNNRQELSTNNEAYSHSIQSHSQHQSGLFNLWNKLDTIEKQLEESSNKSRDEKYYSSSEYMSSQNSYSQGLVNTSNSYQHLFAPSVNMYDTNNNKTINISNGQSLENYDKMRPQDIGRGDIGSEDLSNEDVTEKTINYPDINKNPLIPVASGDLNKQINGKDQGKAESFDRNSAFVPNLPTSISSNENTELDVSLHNNKQGFEEFGKETETNGQQNVESLRHETERQQNFEAQEKYLNAQEIGTQHKQQQHVKEEIIPQENLQTFEQDKKNVQQHNTQQFGQQNVQNNVQLNKNLENQNLQNFSQQVTNLEQQYKHDFGQQNENLDQQNVQNFGQLNENLDQQNLQDFGQQNENLEQQNVQGFGQQKENLDQQNLQDFGQQNENLEQQNVQDFGQKNENLEQQSVQDFGQQNENLEQQNVQDFGQLNGNLEQQNLQDFGQQNVQDFGQQNENLEQQNVQDFGQQNENLEQQNVQGFGQQKENLDQQNLQDFGQQNVNLEQQNVQDFGQKNENLEQQSVQDFGQQNENLDQQNVQDFGQLNGNLEQQNLQDFGQQNENLEQQNVQDFGQQNENLEQQNVQDFGQQNENLEQQNVQDFGQNNKNLEQQNLQDFEQQNENLEQQNVQDFGQQNDNWEQQNVRDFRQQNENLEHQNVNFEQQNVQDQESVRQGRENYNQNGFHKLEQVMGNFEQHQSNSRESLDNFGQVQTEQRPRPEKMEVIPVETPQHINLQSTPPKSPVIEPPPEPVSVKPGFWKSVGNKFVNAKDKVFSWFGS